MLQGFLHFCWDVSPLLGKPSLKKNKKKMTFVILGLTPPPPPPILKKDDEILSSPSPSPQSPVPTGPKS